MKTICAKYNCFKPPRLTNAICQFVFFLLPLAGLPQSIESIRFNHFSEEHGLPLSWYPSILQDNQGYMWFGLASGGLIRYDGYSFKTFTFDPFNKNSLGTLNARSLCTDIHGNVWVAGDGGVSKYDRHHENFVPYWNDWYGAEHKFELHDSGYLAALPTALITCVTSDKLGRVWIGTGEGLCYLDPLQQKLLTSQILLPQTLSVILVLHAL